MSPRLQSAGRHRRYVVGFILLLVLVVVLAIGACGGGNSPASGDSTAESTAAATGGETAGEPVTATTPAFAEDVTIEPGSRKALVKKLQRSLAALGFDPGPVDGIYGQRTTKAVRAFQRNARLEATGTVGQETAAALNDALAGLGG